MDCMVAGKKRLLDTAPVITEETRGHPENLEGPLLRVRPLRNFRRPTPPTDCFPRGVKPSAQ